MMFHAVQKVRVLNEQVYDLARKLLWLQADADFTVKLRWTPSGNNWETDSLMRLDAREHVRFHKSNFNDLWVTRRGFDIDLMAFT